MIKIIGMDLDGVVRNLFKRLAEVYKKYYPDHEVNPIEKWSSYHVAEYFPIGEQIYKFWFKDHVEEIYLGAESYDGALELMKELYKDSFLVIVSSQPNKRTEFLTEEWIKQYSVPHDHKPFFTPDKSLFAGDFILDDYTKHLEAVKQRGLTTPICFNQPWNQDWQGLRVYDYQQFLDIVRNHK